MTTETIDFDFSLLEQKSEKVECNLLDIKIEDRKIKDHYIHFNFIKNDKF